MIKSKFSFSLLALIAANMVPLIGALFFDWDVNLILALFWIENLIIGAFNLIKMGMVALQKRAVKDLLQCLFFVVHYGLFCAVHGLFLWDLLDLGEMQKSPVFLDSSIVFMSVFNEGVSVFISFVDRFEPFIWLGISALALSHLVSFIEHFIVRGEIFKLTISKLMGQPYGQIIVMHAGLMAGAFALEKFGSPIWLLVIIVSLKIFIDIAQHTRRHGGDPSAQLNIVVD